MSIFTMDDLKTEQAKRPAFVPLAENLYVLEVFDAVEQTGPAYQDPTKEITQVKITFKVLKTVDGTPVIDITGELPKSDLISDWINPASVAWNVKTNKPHKARAVLTAIMGVPMDAPLEIEKWEDLIGRKVKAYLTVNTRPDGSKSAKLDKYSAYTEKK